MARAVCSSAPLSRAALFLRACRLGRGLVCHVSAVSRGRSPGNCFPQLEPQLFVITGKAVTSRSRSSPTPMGWWSAQRNDYRSPLVELANTSSSVRGSTTRGNIVQARAAPPRTYKQNSTSQGRAVYLREAELPPCVHKHNPRQYTYSFASAAQNNIPIFI
jgi:hypothetical protein